MSARVYVTQVPNRFIDGQYVPSVDIGPASEHGELVVMMPAQASFHATADLVRQMKEHLRAYNYDAGDSIIALGDPTIMAAAFGVLGSLKGKFRVLKWDRSIKRYTAASIIL